MEEESNDVDTSSDEAEEDNEITEKNECTDATTSSQDNKQEVMEEQCCEKKEGENEKKTSGEEKIQSKKPSQPAIFVPVDRSPEIQVCACAWSLYLCFLTVTQRVHSYQHDLSNFCCRRLDSSCLCCQRSRSSWRRSEKIPASSYVERQEVERLPKCLSFCMKLAMLRRLSSFVIGYLPTIKP